MKFHNISCRSAIICRFPPEWCASNAETLSYWGPVALHGLKIHITQTVFQLNAESAQWFVLLTDSGLESSQFRNNSEICPWSAVSKMLHLYVPLFPFQHHLFCLITAKALHHKDLPFTGICEMFFTTHLWIHSGHRTAKPTLITAINNKCCNLSAVIALLLTTQETKILRSKKQEKFNIALPVKYEKNLCILKMYAKLSRSSPDCYGI